MSLIILYVVNINFELRFNKIIDTMFYFITATHVETKKPCTPSPCGPNSQCREINDQAVCSCLSNYIGNPPNCRPECVISSECSMNKACMNNKCIDPCPGPCAPTAFCRTINHSPICSCKQGQTGNPFSQCYNIPCKYYI